MVMMMVVPPFPKPIELVILFLFNPKFLFFLLHQTISPIKTISATNPPTTPPAIAPTGPDTLTVLVEFVNEYEYLPV